MTSRTVLSELPGYGELQALADGLKSASMEGLFAKDPNRASHFTLEAAGLRLDYSKHLLTAAVLLAGSLTLYPMMGNIFNHGP